MNKYVVIWDWDNTLIDTKEAVSKALNDVTIQFGVSPLTPVQIQEIIGTALSSFWRQFGSHMPEVLTYYRERYMFYAQQIRPFSQAEKILAFLKKQGIPQVVVSNKNQRILWAECKKLNWRHYFKHILGTDAAMGLAKPDKAFAAKALHGIVYDKIIVIGDGLSDMALAHALKAVSILVHPVPSLSVCSDYVCHDLTAVHTVLSQILKVSEEKNMNPVY